MFYYCHGENISIIFIFSSSFQTVKPSQFVKKISTYINVLVGPSTKPSRPVRKSAEVAKKPVKQPEIKIIKPTTATTENPAESQKQTRARQQE